MKVTVLSGQSLTDIAIQVYGSAEGVVALAEENGLEVTDELEAGQVLEFRTENIASKSIANYYSMKRIHPATAVPFDPEAGVWDESFDLTFK